MTNRSMQGKPVFPMRMRKLPMSSGKIAVWKEFMESGVRVNPRSLNIDAEVKKPLAFVRTMQLVEFLAHTTKPG